MKNLTTIAIIIAALNPCLANFAGPDRTYRGDKPPISIVRAYEIAKTAITKEVGPEIGDEYRCIIIGAFLTGSPDDAIWRCRFFKSGHKQKTVVIPFSTLTPRIETSPEFDPKKDQPDSWLLSLGFLQAYSSAKENIPEGYEEFYCVTGWHTHVGGLFRFHSSQHPLDELYVFRDGKIEYKTPSTGVSILAEPTPGLFLW